MTQPPLRPLHSDATLVGSKLAWFRTQSTSVLIDSLRPGKKDALKARPDGTMLDGHHRIKVLLERRENVNALPREIVHRQP